MAQFWRVGRAGCGDVYRPAAVVAQQPSAAAMTPQSAPNRRRATTLASSLSANQFLPCPLADLLQTSLSSKLCLESWEGFGEVSVWAEAPAAASASTCSLFQGQQVEETGPWFLFRFRCPKVLHMLDGGKFWLDCALGGSKTLKYFKK